jgi:hypothetical protein
VLSGGLGYCRVGNLLGSAVRSTRLARSCAFSAIAHLLSTQTCTAFPTSDYGGVPHDRTRVQTPRLGSCPCEKRKSIYLYSPVRGSTSRGSDWELALDAEELAPSVCPALLFQCLSNLCIALSPGNVCSIRGDRGRSRQRCPLVMNERASQLRNLACQRGDNCRTSSCPPTGEPSTFNLPRRVRRRQITESNRYVPAQTP